jgi:STE24 endopeptidase
MALGWSWHRLGGWSVGIFLFGLGSVARAAVTDAGQTQGKYTLPPEELAKAIHLSHARTLAHFGHTAWMILALWLLVRLRLGERLRDWTARWSQQKWIQGFLVAPVWLAIWSLLGLPVSVLMERVYRGYGISVESWGRWFGDYGKSLGLMVVFGTLAFSFLYALMRRSERRWWLWFWVLTLPVEVLGIYAVPIFIDPLFDHFAPLAASDPALVGQLQRVAERGHLQISPDRMFVMAASEKVTAPNAYVTGFGASKRIVVWDTTIKRVPMDEILAVYGHEQGHYVLEHIQKGLLFSAAGLLVFFWIAYRAMRWLVRRDGRISGVEDWASVGLLLLVVTVLSFLGEPVGNAFSRWEEHQADVYGQEVIHGLVSDPQATMARSFQRLGELWLDVPEPNRFLVWWTYSHPPTSDRLDFGAHYDPWQPGKHPRFVAGP